jgi:hypothetical protein
MTAAQKLLPGETSGSLRQQQNESARSHIYQNEHESLQAKKPLKSQNEKGDDRSVTV